MNRKYCGDTEKRWNFVLFKLRYHKDLWGDDDAKTERIRLLIEKVQQHVWKWENGRIGAWCVYVDDTKPFNVLSRHYKRQEAEQALRSMMMRHPRDKNRFFVSWRPASQDVHPHPLRYRLITPPLD